MDSYWTQLCCCSHAEPLLQSASAGLNAAICKWYMSALIETCQLCQASCHDCFVLVAVTDQHVLVHAVVLVAMQQGGKHSRLLIQRCQYWRHSHDSCLCLCVYAHVCMQLTNLCIIEALAEGDSKVMTAGAPACYAIWQALQIAAQVIKSCLEHEPVSECHLSTPTRRCTTS